MKRRILLFPVLFTLLLSIFPGCDICGSCEWVSIDADGNETRSAPQPFCGDDLLDKRDDVPETINGVTTYWDCY